MTPDPLAVITVTGTPGPQGSKSGHAIKKGGVYTGGVAMHESSKKVRPWRQDVIAAAKEQVPWLGRRAPLDDALAVSMVFTFTRPAGQFGTGRNAGLLKPSAPPFHAVYPDVSKLARSTEDALTQAGLWRDDSRIAFYVRLDKVFAGEDAEALSVPGAIIRVWAAASVRGRRSAGAVAPEDLFTAAAT